jgi:hypothetical protein
MARHSAQRIVRKLSGRKTIKISLLLGRIETSSSTSGTEPCGHSLLHARRFRTPCADSGDRRNSRRRQLWASTSLQFVELLQTSVDLIRGGMNRCWPSVPLARCSEVIGGHFASKQRTRMLPQEMHRIPLGVWPVRETRAFVFYDAAQPIHRQVFAN